LEEPVPHLDAPFPVNLFFNAVRQLQAEVRRARRCVPANAGPCIQRVRLRLARVRSASVPRFHLLGPRALAPALVVQRGVPVSATFPVA
jgi:hypothetical protein